MRVMNGLVREGEGPSSTRPQWPISQPIRRKPGDPLTRFAATRRPKLPLGRRAARHLGPNGGKSCGLVLMVRSRSMPAQDYFESGAEL